jgi:hypothetical protein
MDNYKYIDIVCENTNIQTLLTLTIFLILK